jgi:hypothetical protein
VTTVSIVCFNIQNSVICPQGAFMIFLMILTVKAIPVSGRGGPYSYETTRLQHFLDNRLTDGDKFVSPTHRPLFTSPGRFLVHISVRDWVDPRAMVRLGGVGQLKKSSDLIGNRTRDLPACSIMTQLTTLPRTPILTVNNNYFPKKH